MKQWLALLLIVFLNGTTAWAAGPVLPQIFKSGATDSQADRKIDVVPDPASLRADWFRYFAVPGDQLDERVASAKQLLDRRYGEQARQTDPDLLRTVNRIQASLDAFAKASDLRDPQNLPAPEVLDQYTPEQALSLVSALRKARLDLTYESNDTDALQSGIDDALRQLDQQMVSYLQLGSGEAGKLAAGLNIMSERITTATSQLQLRLRQRALEIRKAQVDELARAEAVAEQRLVASDDEIRRLDAELTAISPVVDARRRAVFVERRRVLESSVDTLEDELAARYRQQRAIKASVALESAVLRELNLRTQRDLAGMLVPGADFDPAPINDRLSVLADRMKEARENIERWRNGSERERERAGALLSNTGDGPPVQDAVRLMNQDRLRLAQETVSDLSLLTDELTQLEFLARWTSRTLHSHEGPIARVFSRVSESAAGAGQWVAGAMDRSLFKLGETPVTLSGLFKVVVIVLFAWALSWIFRRVLVNVGHRFENESQSLVFIISRLSHYLIILIGIIAGLSSIGLSFTNFALVAGALALGLGFGLQTIVNNFLSGLILFFEQTVKVGDFVELDNGLTGEIKSINVRGTIVNTNDNIDVVVPNSAFTERKVINWTLLDPFRRIHVPFRVAYEADEEKVVEAGLEAAGKLSSTLTGVLGREPSVWLVNYGENGLEFELIVWLMPDAVKRPDAIYAAYHWEIKKALRRHEIEVPVPQREIRIRPGHLPRGLPLE